MVIETLRIIIENKYTETTLLDHDIEHFLQQTVEPRSGRLHECGNQ